MSQDNHGTIFATAILLKQYQLLEQAAAQNKSTAAAAWLKHAVGEQAIIAAKHPSHYAHGHAHRLFVDTRLNLLYRDLHSRKRSIFSNPAWKSDPWITCTKDPKDELLDVLADVPGLLEDFDLFLACSPKQGKEYRRLRRRLEAKCWKYDKQLEWWATTSGASTLTLVEAVISNNRDQSKTPSLVDLAMAHLGMVYWSTCILVYHPLWTLVGTIHEKLLYRVTPRQFCRNIALLMPYFLAPEVGDFSISMTGFPAIVALRYLASVDPAQHPSEKREMLLNSFSSERGRGLRNFLNWLGHSDRVCPNGAEQGPPGEWQREA